MKIIKKVLRGNLLIFTVGDVMRQMSIFITIPYLSLYIQALGGNIVDIGLIISSRYILAFFMYPLAGYLTDKYNRVKLIAYTTYLLAAIYSIFMLAPDWKFLAYGNFLMGLTALFFPAMNAMIADSLPSQHRGIGYSLWRVIPAGIGIIFPYIGAYLITIIGVEQAMRILYGLSIITTIGIGTMNLKFLQETTVKNISHVSKKGLLKILSDSYRNMFKVLNWLPRSLKAFTLILMLSFFINSLVAPYWIIYSVEKIGLSTLQWGSVLFVAMAIFVVLLVPAGIIADRYNTKKVISLALALSVLPILLFPLSRSYLDVMQIVVVITVANVFLASSIPAYMAHSVPSEKRGSVMAALGQGRIFVNTVGGTEGPGMGAILTIPSIVGSILGGFVYSYNSTLPRILLSASMITCMVIWLLCVRSS